MSKAQSLVVGERVSLIPFKHKGKIGTIKFIGEIEGKNQGNWVGIELDEPKGDCSGDSNGQQIYECKQDHGLFLRPTQVKSLDCDNTKINESSIMRMDESLISGMDQFLGNGSLIGQDLKQLEQNLFKDPTLSDENKQITEVHVQNIQQKDDDQNIDKGGQSGKLKGLGWKERLQKLREEKEKEKKIIEESRVQQSTTDEGGSGSFITSDSLEKVKEIFAPAKGLEKGTDGKLQIDKEKIEVKKELDFEVKSEKIIDKELENQIKNPSESIISQVSELADEKRKAAQQSPQKQKLSMAERQALRDQEKKLQVSTQDISKKEPQSSLLKAPSKGLKQPTSALPNALTGATNATEQRKQKLLEKQKAVNAKMEEKAKQTADKTSTTAQKVSQLKQNKAGNDSATSRNSVFGKPRTSLKPDDTKAKLRQSLAATVNKATQRISGRQSARDGEEGKEEVEEEDQSKIGTSKVRGQSGNKDKELQFGRGRQSSKSRDQDIQGLGKTRGQSATKDKDLQFGKKDKERSGSRDKLSFGFGKQNQPVQQEVKLDPSMTVIKIKELDDLKAELEQKKEEVYNITIKMKKAENQCEILKRDHKDEIDKVSQDLLSQNKEQTEDLVKKHGEERNRLIQEANQSGDQKFIKLQAEHQIIQKEYSDLQEKLQQTIQDLSQHNKEQSKQLEDQYQMTITQLESNLNLRIEQLQASLNESNQQVIKTVEKIQSNKIKIEQLEETIQANKIDLEANQLEIDLLKEEKQELLAEMTENNKLEQDDILNTLGTDELKQQNRKLRQAITSLAANFENEKVKLQKQIEDEEGKKKLIAQYEKKLIDMDVLLEELDRKEEELAEVRMENEACLEYETMVEEMAQEILKKEEENDKLEKNIKSLEDILTIQEGYSENLEQYNQELAEELAEKDAELSQIEQQKIDDEELLLDLEDENQKYREKVQQFSQTIKDLSEQLEQHADDGKEKSKIALMIEKQNNLVHQLKDSEKKELDQQIRKIDYHWDTVIKQKVIESIIPPRLSEHVHFDSLQKLNLLNQTLNRGLLMMRYICEKQMPNVVNMYGGDGEEEFQKKIEFTRMMVKISEFSVQFINSGQRIMICLNNMSPDQYVKATTTFMAFNKLQAVSEEMGNVIDKLKDQNISIRFDTSLLDSLIKQIAELQFKIEKFFIEKTPEELAQEKPQEKEDEKAKYQLSPAQIERQKLVQQTYKLDVRHQSLRMCFGIIALKVLTNDLILPQTQNNQNFSKKALLIYGRLLDIVFKLDHIDAEDTGKQYLNLQDLVIDKRLNEKFEVIKIIWDENYELDQLLKKDWNSIMDAIQKDITQLFNDYKFKRLIKQIEQTYESQNSQMIVNIDHIYFIDKFKNDSSPWMQISGKIKQDIQNSEALKDKIEALNSKNREQVKLNMQQDRTINTMKVTTKSLEQRLTQAQTTIEELNSVKSENEQLQKKGNVQNKRLDQCLKDIDSQNKINQDLLKRLDEAEKRAAQGSIAIEQQMNQSAASDSLGGFRKVRGGAQPSRQSRTSTFFQELAKTSMLGGRKVDTSMTPMNMSASRNQQKGVNSIEMQKQLIQQEESYTNIIYQLQMDRMRLRGNQISQKLAEIQKKNGALNQYTKLQKEKLATKVNISRDEENLLVNAVEKVMSLKTNAKLQMASVKVINLQKKKEDIAKAQQEEKNNKHFAVKRIQKLNKKLGYENLDLKSDCEKTNMNINYMIMQARELINEAVKKLMSKDQNLTMLHIDKLSKQAEKEYYDQKYNMEAEDMSDSDDGIDIEKQAKFKNKVVIGSIEMSSGKDKNNEAQVCKDVVFNVKSIRAMQNNIAIFSI